MARAALNASTWPELQSRLKDELEFNPLDAECPPTCPQADNPDPMAWVVDGNRNPEVNPDGKNSLALQLQIRKWELDSPDMCVPPSLHERTKSLTCWSDMMESLVL